MTKIVCLLAVWAALLGAEAPAEESYALYSSIYKTSPALEADEVIGIVDEAGGFQSLGCFKPGTQEEREMVEAARDARERHIKWEARFDLGHAYKLIPAAEKYKAINCVQGYTHGKPLAGCEAYLKMRYVRFFTAPVFNRDHTRVLIEISRVCGGLCGEGSSRVYRKTHAGWELETDSFAKCNWVA